LLGPVGRERKERGWQATRMMVPVERSRRAAGVVVRFGSSRSIGLPIPIDAGEKPLAPGLFDRDGSRDFF